MPRSLADAVVHEKWDLSWTFDVMDVVEAAELHCWMLGRMLIGRVFFKEGESAAGERSEAASPASDFKSRSKSVSIFECSLIFALEATRKRTRYACWLFQLDAANRRLRRLELATGLTRVRVTCVFGEFANALPVKVKYLPSDKVFVSHVANKPTLRIFGMVESLSVPPLRFEVR